MGLVKKWLSLPQWQQILLSLLAGLFTGIIFKDQANILLPIGTLFIHALQMLVGPVILTAIVCAILSLQEIERMGKIIIKAFSVYAMTMMLAAILGILIANFFHVGSDLNLSTAHTSTLAATPALKLSSVLINLIPKSPAAAFASNNVMQILCFAFLFGLAIRFAGAKGKPVKDFFFSLSEVVFVFAKMVIAFAPYGIFAIMASVTGQYGIGILLPLAKLIGVIYLSCGILIFFIFGSLLLLHKINPFLFFSNILEPLMTSFVSASSAATLPVTMRCAREKLNIQPGLADFLLPLGLSLNLNGLAIYLSAAAVFAANAYGISLSLTDYMTLITTIVLTAAGAAAIPSSGLIVMGAVFSSIGLPLGALPIIAGVDRFNDMAQTMTNVAGDLFATTVVAKHEDMLIMPLDDESVEVSH